jgi:hypothetical protein
MGTAGLDGAGDRLGDGQWRSPERPRELHRQVRREIAVFLLGRPLDFDVRRGLVGRRLGQLAGLDGLLPCSLDRVAHASADGPLRARFGRGGLGWSGRHQVFMLAVRPLVQSFSQDRVPPVLVPR